MKKVAILQSNYIPWKGYFDIMNFVDEFVIYDVVQYTRRDWRNRNLIKTRHGLKWLTIPVEVKGKYFQSIKDTKVSSGKWAAKHWTSIKYNYTQSQYFALFEDQFNNVFEKAAHKTFLTDINILFIDLISSILNIDTNITFSDAYEHTKDKNNNIIEICKALNGNDYVSGPSASCYLDELMFRRAGINLKYFNYTGYQEYIQKFPPFIHKVSVLDLLFNTGNDANKYLISNFQKNTIKPVYKQFD